MKKILALLFLVILAAAAIYFLKFYHHGPGGGKPDESMKPVEVTVGSMQSLVTAQGTLEPKEYVDVGAQVSGIIEKMHVDIGDTVEKGDLIAEIDPDVYESEIRADKAKLKNLQAQKAEQEALVKQAQWKLDRNKNLYKDRAVSKEDLEDTEIDLEVAQAGLLSLEAQIEESESTLEGDETNLSYTKIYASMSGTITDQSVTEGETINASQTTPDIVQIADLDVMTAYAEVAEADVMKLKEGMSAYFTTLGSGTRKWEGTVRQIQPTPEEVNDVVLYNVLVDVPNEDHALMTGMTTQMFFIADSVENMPIIPYNYLGRRVESADNDKGDGYEVHVLTDKGVEVRTVLVRLSDRTEAAVAEGLEAGEFVVPPIEIKAKTETNKDAGGPPPGMGHL